jgi:hypothetical protein
MIELPNIETIRAISREKFDLLKKEHYLEKRAEIVREITIAAECGHMDFIIPNNQLLPRIAQELESAGYTIKEAHQGWTEISWEEDND